MQTHRLIEALVADLQPLRQRLPGQILMRLGWAALAAALAFYGLYGFRDDGLASLGDPRFAVKISLLLTLVGALWPLMRRAAGPIKMTPTDFKPLAWVGLFWLTMMGLEVALVPQTAWYQMMVGENGLFCLAAIPLIGMPLLATIIVTLRGAAPAVASVSGAVAGFFSAAIASVLYAVHCPDDSPFFLVVWYGAATMILMAMGALSGRWVLRW